MNLKSIWPLLWLLFASASAWSQSNFGEGFVLTLDGDTLRGQVAYQTSGLQYRRCIFRQQHEQLSYEPHQVRGYGYAGGQYFSSQIVEGEFVEVLIDGTLSLYKSRRDFSLKKEGLDSLMVLRTRAEGPDSDEMSSRRRQAGRLRSLLASLVLDCLDVTQLGEDYLTVSEARLLALVSDYNTCRGGRNVHYKSALPRLGFDIGLSLGISRVTLNIENHLLSRQVMSPQYRRLVPSAGMLFSVYAPRISRNLRLEGEAHFSHFSHKNLFVNNLVINTFYHEHYLSYSTISTPISLKYEFYRPRYTLFLQAGLRHDYQFNITNLLRTEEEIGRAINTSWVSVPFAFRPHVFGLWGGLGVQKTFPGFDAGLRLSYSRSQNMRQGTDVERINNNQLSIQLIYWKK